MAPVPRDPKRPTRFIIPILGVALSVAGLAYVYRDFDLNALLESTSRIRFLPLAGTIIVYWAGTVMLRSLLLRHLLAPLGRIDFFGAYRYICIGFLANNVLPFRAGEMARSAAVHKGSGIPFSSVVGSLALERMLDMGMVAAIALAALQFAPLPGALRNAALGTAGVVVLGLVVVVMLARRKWRETDGEAKGPIQSFLWNNWVRFSAGLKTMASARAFGIALALVAGLWCVTLVSMWFRLEAFDLEATPSLALTLLTCLGFGVAIPSAPGYVGVYHAAAAFALTLHGIDHATAAAYALFSWLLDIGVSSAFGAVSLSIEGLRLADLRKKAPAEGE